MSHKPDSYYAVAYKENGEGCLVLEGERRIAPESEKIYPLLRPAIENSASELFLAGETHARPDYYCHYRAPHFALLLYFESGSGSLKVNKKECKLRPGDTVLLREGNEWEYKTDKNDPWHIHWVELRNAPCLSLLDLYDMPASAVFNDADLGLTVKKIVLEIKNTVRFVPTRDNVMQYLLHFVQHTSSLLAGLRSQKKQARDAYIMMDHINSHVSENVRVSDLAKLVFRSAGGAANAFRAVYGCSIKDYILRVKLETAARLLREGEHQVSDIADMLAFCDAQHFSRMFRMRYGMSPTRFRKLFRTGGSEVISAVERGRSMSFDDMDLGDISDEED